MIRLWLSFCEGVPLRVLVAEVGQLQESETVKHLLLLSAVPMHHTHLLRNDTGQVLYLQSLLEPFPQACGSQRQRKRKAEAAVSQADVSPMPMCGCSGFVFIGNCSSLKTSESSVPPNIRRMHCSKRLSNGAIPEAVESAGVTRRR